MADGQVGKPRAEHLQPDGHADAARPTGFLSWINRYNTVVTIVAASFWPICYLIYVSRFAANALLGDDWKMVPMLGAAVHGHVPLGQLWSQYGDARLPVARLIFIVFALGDRFDTRAVIFFNAGVLIASFAVLLALLRHYLGRRLSPVPVFVVGIVWFSLASVQSALWAFLMTWYLVELFLLCAVFALVVPRHRRSLWISIAIIAAILASLSFLQGFLVWPVGAICLLWCQPWSRRVLVEIGVWTGAAVITATTYFAGYNVDLAGCYAIHRCQRHAAVSHPFNALHYVVILIGNVIPGEYLKSPVRDLTRFEIVGGVLLVLCFIILIQSWRTRRSQERFPLPLLLITFALLFDLTIAIGRTGAGPRDAVLSNRYVLPNLILLVGIVIYTLARIPSYRFSGLRTLGVAKGLVIGGLAVFLGVQTVVAIGFGISNGRLDRQDALSGARLGINLDQVPTQDRTCELKHHQIPAVDVTVAQRDQLGEFAPNAFKPARRSVSPVLFPVCAKRK